MELTDITTAIRDGVAEIVLDRPDQLNPISAGPLGTRAQIVDALATAEADPSVGCVLIRGSGKAFSAGGDLSGGVRRETAVEHLLFLEEADAFHARLRSSRVPVLAAVHGFCLGAALHLVTACDLVIAAPSARFGLPEGRIGLVGVGAIVPVIGRQWAKFLIMTGEQIDAECARSIGLVLRVEPEHELTERARDLAVRVARMPREAVLLNRRTVDAIADTAGASAGRVAALAAETSTLANSPRATAPDGRSFREILATEGLEGMKRARSQQYDTPWLRPIEDARTGDSRSDNRRVSDG